MKMFIIGFVSCYILAAIVSIISENRFEEIFFAPISAVMFAVRFIPTTLWYQFRLTIHPTTKEKVEFVRSLCDEDKHRNIYNNLWMCIQKDPDHWYHKIFFYKVER